MSAITEKFKDSTNVIIVAVTIFVCAIIFSYTMKSRIKNTSSISVWGLGTKDFISDLVVWNGSFSCKNMDQKLAYEQLTADKEKVASFLASMGINPKEIIYSAIDMSRETEQNYDNEGRSRPKFSGYRLTQRVTIESKEVEKVEEVSRQVTQLLNKGVEFYSETPQYYYTKLADLKLEMIASASDDARKRAEAIAEKSHASLGKLRLARTDVFQIAAQYSNEAFTYGGLYNTAARNKTATITIKIIYDVN
jgi:uncharacterized protein